MRAGPERGRSLYRSTPVLLGRQLVALAELLRLAMLHGPSNKMKRHRRYISDPFFLSRAPRLGEAGGSFWSESTVLAASSGVTPFLWFSLVWIKLIWQEDLEDCS